MGEIKVLTEKQPDVLEMYVGENGSQWVCKFQKLCVWNPTVLAQAQGSGKRP